jgi:uncharacterized protein
MRLQAAADGDAAQLRVLLDTDVAARLLDRDRLGRTALHLAAATGRGTVVDFITQRCGGVGERALVVNARDAAGNGPLHLAAGEGHVDVVDALLNLGAEVRYINT